MGLNLHPVLPQGQDSNLLDAKLPPGYLLFDENYGSYGIFNIMDILTVHLRAGSTVWEGR